MTFKDDINSSSLDLSQEVDKSLQAKKIIINKELKIKKKDHSNGLSNTLMD